ncbi:MAG: murein biosynthesis integral membrane protein MurJ [Deltaproteobacteria bacterium]
MEPQRESQRGAVSRAAGVVGFFTFLSRILGLVRDMVLAALFGSGMAADAFFVAFRIPNLLRRLFAEGSLTISFIPIFTEYLSRKSKEDAFDLARIVLTLLSIILALVTVMGVLLSPWIVRLQAFGFGDTGLKYELTVLLTRITFPYIFFISIVAFFMGVLNSLKHFAAPAAAPIFLNVGIIAAGYLISPHLGEPIVGIAIGVLIGGFLQVILQIPWAVKRGLKLIPKWQPDHPALKRIGLLMLPAIFGSAVYQLNQFIGTLLASFLTEGSVSWLYYADRLVQFPLGIFADTLGLVFFIALPSTVGLILLGRPIIQLLFERGAFTIISTSMTNYALLCYALGLWAFSANRIIISAFYALQDTKTPVKVAVITVMINLGLSLLLMGPFKHGGLALALSLASLIQFCLLMLLLKRKIDLGDMRPVYLSWLKSTLAAAVMGVGLFAMHAMWFPVARGVGLLGMIIELSFLILTGMLLYGFAARLLKCNELNSLMEAFRRRRGSPLRKRK